MAPAQLVQPYGALQQYTKLATAWATRFASKESFQPTHNPTTVDIPPAWLEGSAAAVAVTAPLLKRAADIKTTPLQHRANKPHHVISNSSTAWLPVRQLTPPLSSAV